MAKRKPKAKKAETRGRKPQREFVRGGSLSTNEPEPFNDTDFSEILDVKKRLYIQAVARYPGLTMAAQKAGVSPMCAWLWRNAGDPVFDAAWQRARRLGLTRAESELWRRGVEGYDKPVYHQGQLVGTERVFSDTAAIFMLKGAMPDVYRERFEHSGPAGGPIEVSTYAGMSDEELRRRADIVREALLNAPGPPRNDDLSAVGVALPDDPVTRYAAVLAARKAGNGNGSNGGGR